MKFVAFPNTMASISETPVIEHGKVIDEKGPLGPHNC